MIIATGDVLVQKFQESIIVTNVRPHHVFSITDSCQHG